MIDPETVTAEAPIVKVWLPNIYTDVEFAVIVRLPTVMAGKELAGFAEATGRNVVVPPITILAVEGARDTVSPEIVIAGLIQYCHRPKNILGGFNLVCHTCFFR